MKKIICLLTVSILIFSLCGVVAFAEGEAEIPTNLVNPTSLAILQNDDQKQLFVADNITGNASVLHLFDADTATWQKSVELVGNVNKIAVYGDTMYIIQKDGYRVIEDLNNIEVGEFVPFTSIVDVAVVGDVVYALQNGIDGSLGHFGDLFDFSLPGDAGSSVVKGFAVVGGTLYILEDATLRLLGNWGPTTNGGLTNCNFAGVFACGDNLALHNANDVVFLSAQNSTSLQYTSSQSQIVSVCADSDGSLYVLRKDNTIKKVVLDETYSELANWEIGDDTYSGTIPTGEWTSYTLCKAKNYPATIVYKTTDGDTSIQQLTTLSPSEAFIVLNYDNADENFYYVFYGNKFGWIRKSALTLEEDPYILVLNTNVSTDATVSGNLLNENTFIYSLPIQDQRYETATSTTYPRGEKVVLLQSFFNFWYLVQFEDGTQGFVAMSSVGALKVESDLTVVLARKKVNSSLSGEYFAYADWKNQIPLTDANGNSIVLQTGQVVKILAEYDGYCLVQFEDNQTFAYVQSDVLIGLQALNTNTILGLVLVGVAIVIGVVVFIILKDKQKKQLEIE